MDDLLVFHELARSLISTLDLSAILRTVLSSMDRFIQADLWALLMVDPPHLELYYVGQDGREDPRFTDMRVKMGEGLAGWVAKTGETLIIPEAAADPRLVAAFRKQMEAFNKALALRDPPVAPLRIPFEGTSLPACFIPAVG